VTGSTFISRDLAGNETAVELRRPGGELRFSVGRAALSGLAGKLLSPRIRDLGKIT